MKTRIITLLALFLVGSAFADTEPDWYFPEQQYLDSEGSNATCTAQVYIDGIRIETDKKLEIAFFDEEGNCRARNCVRYFSNVDFYAFMSVFSGFENRPLTIKFYDYEQGKTNEDLGYVCITSIIYNANATIGSIDYPQEIHFYKPTTCTFTNVNGNSWSSTGNWSPRIPLSIDDAIIDGTCLVETGTETSYKSLTIRDGAQFFDANGTSHTATVEKHIAAYSGERDNYYFIASPIGTNFDFAETGMLTGEYDLYFFQINGKDEFGQKKEWQNYKFYLQHGILKRFKAPLNGYLYANGTNQTLQFTGMLNMSNNTIHELDETNIYYCAGERFPGFNLIGNNYACNAAVSGNNEVLGYYMINENDGRSNVIAINDPIVAPCTALFVSIKEPTLLTSSTITFTPTISSEANVRKSSNDICIEVSNAKGILMDRAYIEISENEGMKKFNLNDEATKLYFRQDRQDYAIIRSTEAAQLPLHFETNDYGEYSLNVKMGQASCGYLHLIDNITGADIDLKATPSYTFRAKHSDYASRFRIVLKGTHFEENINEDFVIVEGNRFIIPEVENGSSLTVIDMMGRIVSSQTISGSFDQEMNLANGIYIIRLNEKCQKVVVR